jgi:hypothetical protein
MAEPEQSQTLAVFNGGPMDGQKGLVAFPPQKHLNWILSISKDGEIGVERKDAVKRMQVVYELTAESWPLVYTFVSSSDCAEPPEKG